MSFPRLWFDRWLYPWLRRGFLGCLGFSVAIGLGLGPLATPGHSQLSPQPPRTLDPASLVQQGVTHYEQGNYAEAIAQWQTALATTQPPRDSASADLSVRAIILENLARAHQQLGQTTSAIAQWEAVISLDQQLQDHSQLGRAMTEQAQAYSQLGQPRKAIARLCGEAGLPEKLEPHLTERPLTPEALRQTLAQTCHPTRSAIGLAMQPGRGNHPINPTNSPVPLKSPDPLAPSYAVAALGSLGDVYRLLGHYDLAIAVLNAAQDLNPSTYHVSLLQSLGNVYISKAQATYRRAQAATIQGDVARARSLQTLGQSDDQKALQFLAASRAEAQTQHDFPSELRSLLSALPLYHRRGEQSTAQAAIQQAQTLLTQIPASQTRVYASIELARGLYPSGQVLAVPQQCPKPEEFPLAPLEPLLKDAIATAQQIRNLRAESFAQGELGHLYECQQAWQPALAATQTARLLAEQEKDSLYLWEWQTGRILTAQGTVPEAIRVYEQAIATLAPIRSDILTAKRDLQFDFRETIEPIYRELIALKLGQLSNPIANKALDSVPSADTNEALASMLKTLDGLKLAELQNYFGNDCVLNAVQPRAVTTLLDDQTASLSTVILDDTTAVILSLPHQQQRWHRLAISRAELIRQVNAFRISLEDSGVPYNPAAAQQLYQWLIAPFEQDLDQAGIKTLIFIQDGIFRSVPMAALHDGQQFLIQRYAIATTPSLQLTTSQAFDRQNLRVLAMGLTQATTINEEQFQELPNVNTEVKGVQALIPGSKYLLDGTFTRSQMETELGKAIYPILHIATHSKFGNTSAENFIVLGNQRKLTFDELDQLIRRFARNTNPLELLALTACKTAVGDDRSALGLAGIVIQAGAKSALASLWSINDAATAQIATDFYRQLRQPQVTKAKAIQIAQQNLLNGASINGITYQHPAYWSPFVLVGNWL